MDIYKLAEELKETEEDLNAALLAYAHEPTMKNLCLCNSLRMQFAQLDCELEPYKQFL